MSIQSVDSELIQMAISVILLSGNFNFYMLQVHSCSRMYGKKKKNLSVSTLLFLCVPKPLEN